MGALASVFNKVQLSGLNQVLGRAHVTIHVPSVGNIHDVGTSTVQAFHAS